MAAVAVKMGASALAEVAVRSGRLVEAGHRYRMLDEQQGQLAGEGRHQPSRFLEDRAWVALYLDDLDEAARLFGELEAMAPQDGARAWRARRGQARLLEESGDLVAAGTLLQQVCAVAPEDSPERGEAELDRAVNLMLRDRPGEAIAMFEALLIWAPEPALPMAVEVRGLPAQALEGITYLGWEAQTQERGTSRSRQRPNQQTIGENGPAIDNE